MASLSVFYVIKFYKSIYLTSLNVIFGIAIIYFLEWIVALLRLSLILSKKY